MDVDRFEADGEVGARVLMDSERRNFCLRLSNMRNRAFKDVLIVKVLTRAVKRGHSHKTQR